MYLPPKHVRQGRRPSAKSPRRPVPRLGDLLRLTLKRNQAPPGYRRTTEIKRPKLDGFTEIIDGWLDGDKNVPRKQRQTVKRIHERLKTEHGFTGGYTIIKDYVRQRERCSREMFVPLTHPPGKNA